MLVVKLIYYSGDCSPVSIAAIFPALSAGEFRELRKQFKAERDSSVEMMDALRQKAEGSKVAEWEQFRDWLTSRGVAIVPEEEVEEVSFSYDTCNSVKI